MVSIVLNPSPRREKDAPICGIQGIENVSDPPCAPTAAPMPSPIKPDAAASDKCFAAGLTRKQSIPATKGIRMSRRSVMLYSIF
jgi:hypothetical protein